MNKIILALLISLSMTGCASVKEYLCDKPIPPAEKRVNVDPKLLEPCAPLITLTATNPKFEDFLLVTGDNAIAYGDCKKKQDDSVKFIKSISGITN
jgi:hypothetical protein